MVNDIGLRRALHKEYNGYTFSKPSANYYILLSSVSMNHLCIKVVKWKKNQHKSYQQNQNSDERKILKHIDGNPKRSWEFLSGRVKSAAKKRSIWMSSVPKTTCLPIYSLCRCLTKQVMKSAKFDKNMMCFFQQFFWISDEFQINMHVEISQVK